MLHVSSLLQTFSMCRWDDVPTDTGCIRFLAVSDARNWLTGFKGSPCAMVSLRDALQRFGGDQAVQRESDDKVIDELASLIIGSRVLVFLVKEDLPHQGGGPVAPPRPQPGPRPSPPPKPTPRPPPAPKPADKTHWIEIELKSEDGKLAAGVAYVIVTADKASHSGVTDAKGRARIEGIVAGNCEVSFPALDDEEWNKA